VTRRSPSPDFARPPGGTVTLTARLRADERRPADRPLRERLGTGKPAESTPSGPGSSSTRPGSTSGPGYLQLDSDKNPGVLSALPLPELDAGPFLSYALQWIAFGTMALLAWLYFTWREIKPGGALTTDRPERRKSVAQMLAEDDAGSSGSTPEEQGTFTTAPR
jgi:cytochrome oxidase assembly protein ShyY1